MPVIRQPQSCLEGEKYTPNSCQAMVLTTRKDFIGIYSTKTTDDLVQRSCSLHSRRIISTPFSVESALVL